MGIVTFFFWQEFMKYYNIEYIVDINQNLNKS